MDNIVRLVVDQDIPFFDEQSILCQPIEPNTAYEVLAPVTNAKAPACPIESAEPAQDHPEAPEAGGGKAECGLPPAPKAEPAAGGADDAANDSDATSGSECEDVEQIDGGELMMENEKKTGCEGVS